MALPEVCGLWIEQRVQEELDRKGETGASLRSIGRIISAEVEKYFETKVKPVTIFQRARRFGTDTNVSPKSQPIRNIPKTIENRKPQGGGYRESAGRKPEARDPHMWQCSGCGSYYMPDVVSCDSCERKALKHTETHEVSDAVSFATIAISQLSRIRKDDPKRFEAFEMVTDWIESQ